MQLVPVPQGKPFEEFQFKTMEQSFRNAWTDNADILSLLYTGTPALKTDFTRTGKRSTAGAIQDGRNSVTRYYINNFTDGYNCDCLDLSQGSITAKQKLSSRGFVSPLKIAILGVFSMLIMTHFFLKEVFPREPLDLNASLDTADGQSSLKALVLHGLIYLGVFMVGVLGIMHNGRAFVDDASTLNL